MTLFTTTVIDLWPIYGSLHHFFFSLILKEKAWKRGGGELSVWQETKGRSYPMFDKAGDHCRRPPKYLPEITSLPVLYFLQCYRLHSQIKILVTGSENDPFSPMIQKRQFPPDAGKGRQFDTTDLWCKRWWISLILTPSYIPSAILWFLLQPLFPSVHSRVKSQVSSSCLNQKLCRAGGGEGK